MYKRIKHYVANDSVYYSLLILLVGLSSFALGRLSAVEMSQSGATTVAITEPTATSGTPYIASKNGSKYHFPWCPGAAAMKDENRVVFDNKPAAEAAGYAPAENCPGL